MKPWKWWAASKALKTNIQHSGKLSAPKDVYLLSRQRKRRWHNEVAGIWSKPDTAAEPPSCMTTWHHDGCRQHSHSGPLNLLSLSFMPFFSPSLHWQKVASSEMLLTTHQGRVGRRKFWRKWSKPGLARLLPTGWFLSETNYSCCWATNEKFDQRTKAKCTRAWIGNYSWVVVVYEHAAAHIHTDMYLFLSCWFTLTAAARVTCVPILLISVPQWTP